MDFWTEEISPSDLESFALGYRLRSLSHFVALVKCVLYSLEFWPFRLSCSYSTRMINSVCSLKVESLLLVSLACPKCWSWGISHRNSLEEIWDRLFSSLLSQRSCKKGSCLTRAQADLFHTYCFWDTNDIWSSVHVSEILYSLPLISWIQSHLLMGLSPQGSLSLNIWSSVSLYRFALWTNQ